MGYPCASRTELWSFFSIGPHYKDRTYCDVAPIDVSHLILGRPSQFDRKIFHDGAKNTYSFTWETHRIVLLLTRESLDPAVTPPTPVSPIPPPSAPLLCSFATFEEELRLEGVAFALFSSPVRVVAPPATSVYDDVLQQFLDVFPDELPPGLPPL
ncbi:PREDICTED: uncharacterized protein LOC104709823 [Camelina sativa]|uniref:Uncharacterized protein LOC104709823 n=1 Tax=Camelina sativa TaxID=90675 RepID=A0ABM0TDD9_CAMSA|nr:PREDICTED: uncharacterized protein LOC104709823 [Camelina sativa]